MEILIEMRMENSLCLPMLIELKIKIHITMWWLQYEQTKMVMLTKLIKMKVLYLRNDFITNHYLLDVFSHTMIMIIDAYLHLHEDMIHHIQTTSMLPWRRYASRWAPTSRMWMHC